MCAPLRGIPRLKACSRVHQKHTSILPGGQKLGSLARYDDPAPRPSLFHCYAASKGGVKDERFPHTFRPAAARYVHTRSLRRLAETAYVGLMWSAISAPLRDLFILGGLFCPIQSEFPSSIGDGHHGQSEKTRA